MDVLFFLKERTKFIRQFYINASLPFTERKRKIEAGEPPFVPPYSEDIDSPFEEEWCEASDSLDVLGQSCISMLTNTLHLFLGAEINELPALVRTAIGHPEDDKSTIRKHGWFGAYRKFFQESLGISWGNSPVHLDLIEEVVLARHSSQHAGEIDTFRVRQTGKDFKRFPSGFFIDDFDRAILNDPRLQSLRLSLPSLDITSERVFAAVNEVERFCTWLDEQRLLLRAAG